MNIKRKVAAHHVKKEIVGKKKYFNHLATHETMTCNLCKTVIKKGSRGSHKCNVVRSRGTPQHVTQSKKALASYNSGRAGYSPASEMTIRRPSHPTPPL